MLSTLLFVAAIFLTTACSEDDKNYMSVLPKTFVLVHGSWQGAWAWKTVMEGLEKKGHRVVTIELPAHGDDTTPPAMVSMETYRDKVASVIEELGTKVILVGHSMGGAVITAVAEKIPDKIENLVYIAAFVPADGQNILELQGMDQKSELGPALLISEDQLTIGVKADKVVYLFCQDGSKQIQQLLVDKYRTEPTIPFTYKFIRTDANFGKVKKYYIHTAQDRVISLDFQKQMAGEANIRNSYTLNTGHSPFLSKPAQVTSTLLNIIK